MVLVFLYYRQIQATCPALCNQDSCSYGILLCADVGLDLIPEIPPPKTTKIVLKNQRFRNPILGYKNLSKYGPEEINLKVLTIENCGITEIESESFSHLIHLTEMDLSLNRLQTIHQKTFKALNLKSLRLDGNRFLKLAANSFQGLVVSSLSLANCGLGELKFDSIKEISGHLIKLNLSRNHLKILSLRFYLLFKRLEDIRLEENELKCDCRIKWLNRVLKNDKHSANSIRFPIRCSSPAELKGKTIAKLEESDFLCPKPDLKTISVDISTQSAVLFCSSTPNTDSQVSWRLKHMSNESVLRIEDLIETPNNASIKVDKITHSDRFSCIVTNENGNVSVDLNIRWADDSANQSALSLESPNSVLIFTPANHSSKPTNGNNINNNNNKNNNNNNQLNYLFIKQFTFLEMILSIGITFLVTTVSFSLIYLLISRRMNISIGKHSTMKCRYQGGIYSDTQIYDLPRYSSPQKSYQPSAQLIDFKTQRLITQDIQ